MKTCNDTATTRPLRVLQFITPAGFYGAERWVLALARQLDNRKLICDLAVTRESDDQDLTVAEMYPRSAGEVHYLDMNGRFDWKVVTRLCSLINDREIDIVHTHGYKSDLLGLMAARRTGVKVVSTPHGFSSGIDWKLRSYIRLGVWSLRYFDQVAPLSQALLEELMSRGVPESRLCLIENGVDLSELVAYQRRFPEPGFRSLISPAPHLGYVGQLIPRKGLSDLLHAFNEVFRAYPAARLTLVGEGSQRQELEALAASLPCADAVVFAGFRADRLAVMAEFDQFVMTSALEGIPRSLMEAMVLGVPVLAYDIPGVDQLVDQQATGVLVPHGDWEQLAQASLALLEEPAHALSLARTARQRVEQRFSARRMADDYERLYRRMQPGVVSTVTQETI